VIGASSAKATVSEAFQTDSLAGVNAAATSWNSNVVGTRTKYVSQINIVPATGIVTVTYVANTGNGLPDVMNNKLLVFQPNVNNAVLATTSVGSIDWACGSQTAQTAAGRNLVVAADATNGVPAKWAPSECR
jgi:type IV pilus assembly protein PilA